MKKSIQYKSMMNEYSLKLKKSDFHSSKINSSQAAYDVIKQFYYDDMEIYESFFILLLNRANNTTGYVKISQGGITGTVVDPRIIAKYVLESLSCGIILAHNHPSGNLKPSECDIALTKKVKECLSFCECTVIDHLIVTGEGFLSFADEGYL